MRFDPEDPEVAIRHPNHPLGELGGLFGPIEAPTLPYQPGSDTSRAAAINQREDAAHVRRLVAELYTAVRLRGLTTAQWQRLLERSSEAEPPAVGVTGLTPDEAAWLLERSVLSVRPRTTELLQSGTLQDSGERRRNESGNTAHVLRART